MEEPVGLGQLEVFIKLIKGSIGSGLVAPLGAQIASIGILAINHFAKNVVHRAEEVSSPLKHFASGTVVVEEVRKGSPVVVDRVDVGTGKAHSTIHEPRIGFVGHRGVGLGLVNHADGVFIQQPSRLPIGIARQDVTGVGINFTDGGQSLEGTVGEVGVTTFTIN